MTYELWPIMKPNRPFISNTKPAEELPGHWFSNWELGLYVEINNKQRPCPCVTQFLSTHCSFL